MRIATWNVNSIRARLPYLLEWLEQRAPDVVCLQELKLPDEAFPREVLERAGYQAIVHGQPRWNGVAVLAREPVEVVQRGLAGQEAAGARLLAVRAGGVELVSVYVPNGKALDHADYLLKLDWLRSLTGYVRSRLDAGTPLLVSGDFNVTPTDLDTHGPVQLRGAIHHSLPEREALEQLALSGLTDLFRAAHPDDPGFSWWDYRAGSFHRNLGLRIDLILTSAQLASQVTDVWVDREFRKKHGEQVPSDHAPVIAELSLPAPG